MSLFFLLLYFSSLIFVNGERCPVIFGEFECPLNYKCVDNICSSSDGKAAPLDCQQVSCSEESRCFKGRCYTARGLVCDRNVILSNSTAKSVVSDCGRRGKCLNGRCTEDKCYGVTCGETEVCRDGTCIEMANKFCFTDFDCGPNLDCQANKCVLSENTLQCNCDPGETCQQNRCYLDIKCAHVTCSDGLYCSDGTCVSAVGRDCSKEACQGGTVCIDGKCALDPCKNRCPADHSCRRGQCRHLQGIICNSECPQPYECIDGVCTRNECSQKVCQLGEACENGFCVKVEGRFCTLAIRDCAAEFECESNQCKERINKTISYID